MGYLSYSKAILGRGLRAALNRYDSLRHDIYLEVRYYESDLLRRLQRSVLSYHLKKNMKCETHFGLLRRS